METELNEAKRKLHRKYYRNAKEKLFEILGGKRCSNPNCAVPGGMTDERALQFDHINGDGHKEQDRFGTRRLMVFKHIKDPDVKNKIQVLCANCNWIKRHENNEMMVMFSSLETERLAQ